MDKKNLEILRLLKSTYPDEYQRLVGTMKDIENENKHLKKEIKTKNNLTGLIRHELINPISQIKSIMEIIERSNKDQFDQVKEFARLAYYSAEDMENIVDITKLIVSNYSQEGIASNSNIFYPEDLLRSKNLLQEYSLNENNIALVLKYNKNLSHNKLEIFSSESLFNALFGTLIGNSIDHAPSNSKIRQGLRDSENNLEFRIENYSTGRAQRKLSGTGDGIGLKFADEFVKMLNGKIEKYSDDSRIKQTDYKVTERFGYNGELTKCYSDFFGVEIKIPMKNLTQPENK
jgi:signal transduction histidine kinase